MTEPRGPGPPEAAPRGPGPPEAAPRGPWPPEAAPLVSEFTVACPPEHAWAVWAERTSLWWPATHSVSGAPEAVTFEPRPGGRIYERAPGGAEHDWGRVLAWEPPRRLVYSWHLRQDAAEVEITFAAAGDGTAVTITHRGWERLGAKGPALRERNTRGWAGLLPAFVTAVSATGR